MNKAEEFIEKQIRHGSNLVYKDIVNGKEVNTFLEWLDPFQALRATEIAREEIYEWLRMNFCNYFDDTRETFDKCIDDLKQAIEDK